ncbi:MAG: TIGR03808 family TAT-translocated repetitive protein [Oricola sp.]
MNRRQFLSSLGASALSTAAPGAALAQTRLLSDASLRGTKSAAEYGVLPGLAGDQSAAFQAMLNTAATAGDAVFLPGGTYVLSGIRLPSGMLLEGVPGRTQLAHSGSGPLLQSAGSESITLRGLLIDGLGRPAGEDEGLIDLRNVDGLSIETCTLRGAGGNAVHMEGCSGALRGNTISDAGVFAIYSMDGAGLSVSGNTIRDCRNGGVVIHRSSSGRDGSIVTGNRIENTGAANGGTGEWGNAINFFRTDDVIAANNIISGSAFTAVRGNSVRRMQVIGNICRDSGETAIYAEFAFEDAVIANNTIDGAANGISATNLDSGGHGATITGNIIRNLHMTGPYEAEFPGFGTGIGVEADATVTGNVIADAPLYGINVGWGPYLRDVVISANTIRDARFGIGVSAAEGAGRALIRDNLISARKSGIQAHEWGKSVASDVLTNPAEAPPNVIVSGNVASSG